MFILLKDVLIVFKEKQENKLNKGTRYPMVYDDPGINISQRIRHSQCRAPPQGGQIASAIGGITTSVRCWTPCAKQAS